MSKFTSFIAANTPVFTANYLAVLMTKKFVGFMLAVLINENLLKLFYCVALAVCGLRQNERYYFISYIYRYCFYDY